MAASRTSFLHRTSGGVASPLHLRWRSSESHKPRYRLSLRPQVRPRHRALNFGSLEEGLRLAEMAYLSEGQISELGFARQGGRQATSKRRLSTSAESFGTSR